ncbi:MAG TPA: flavin reductase family protein [Rhodocyclaceae bacterium]|jgi:flavin reductase (DIM6/NTAB) family NADH-FMN oxidoreductase RutF
MIDAASFKAGMRQLSAGVTLVTTQTADGKRSGLTATAVSSVSAEPPILLVCINQQNGSYAAIREAGRFAVNVLAAEDIDLSNRFASAVSGDERFEHGDWSTLSTGAPVLASALTSFDCTLLEMKDMGSHGVFFGRIEAVKVRDDDAQPLLYGKGNYGTLQAL